MQTGNCISDAILVMTTTVPCATTGLLSIGVPHMQLHVWDTTWTESVMHRTHSAYFSQLAVNAGKDRVCCMSHPHAGSHCYSNNGLNNSVALPWLYADFRMLQAALACASHHACRASLGFPRRHHKLWAQHCSLGVGVGRRCCIASGA